MNPNKTMSFVFRGHTVFEYIPKGIEGFHTSGVVIQHKIKGCDIPAFDFCNFINEDYKLMAQFFNTAYHHLEGENVELKDIEVY